MTLTFTEDPDELLTERLHRFNDWMMLNQSPSVVQVHKEDGIIEEYSTLHYIAGLIFLLRSLDSLLLHT